MKAPLSSIGYVLLIGLVLLVISLASSTHAPEPPPPGTGFIMPLTQRAW